MDSSKDKGVYALCKALEIYNKKGKAELREFSIFNNKSYKYIGRIC